MLQRDATEIKQRVAALPWYDGPSTYASFDDFWRVVGRVLLTDGVEGVPVELERNMPVETQWRHRNLLVSQCCGLDLFFDSTRDLEPFAVPVFESLDCADGMYYSHVVSAARQTPVHPRLAINSPTSRSGHAALLAWLNDRDLDWTIAIHSGSHAQSVAALRSGTADVAAIDAFTWRHLDHEGLHVIGRTSDVLAPPFVRRADSDVPAPTLIRAFAAAGTEAGPAVGIHSVMPVARRDYDAVATEARNVGILG